MMGPVVVDRPYHHGDLRAALLDAGLASLEREGQLPSLRALARTCGVSQSAPYRHFPSVEALRLALVVEGFRRLTAEIRAALDREREPFARLAAGTRAYIVFGLAHRALYGLMFSVDSETTRVEVAAEAGREAFGTLVEAVAGCGVRAPLPVAFAAWTAQHGLVDILRGGFRLPGLSSQDALIATELDMLVGYVRATAEAGRTSPPETAPPGADQS